MIMLAQDVIQRYKPRTWLGPHSVGRAGTWQFDLTMLLTLKIPDFMSSINTDRLQWGVLLTWKMAMCLNIGGEQGYSVSTEECVDVGIEYWLMLAGSHWAFAVYFFQWVIMRKMHQSLWPDWHIFPVIIHTKYTGNLRCTTFSWKILNRLMIWL
jgi:hypothetical protein